ncbi:MAG: hypothetical protein PVI34_02125 [Desulfobacterales bacterium]|jgi:hypothetical protein
MTRQNDRCSALPPDYCGRILNGTYSEKLKNRVVETIASHRPYRPALGIEKARKYRQTAARSMIGTWFPKQGILLTSHSISDVNTGR